MAAKTKLSQRLVHDKSTKGTHIYVPEDDSAPQITRSVYFLKTALTDPPPDVITLSIEF